MPSLKILVIPQNRWFYEIISSPLEVIQHQRTIKSPSGIGNIIALWISLNAFAKNLRVIQQYLLIKIAKKK